MHTVLEHSRMICYFLKASSCYHSGCLPSELKSAFIDGVNTFSLKKPVWLVSLGVDMRWKETIRRNGIVGMIISHVVGTRQ